MCEACIARWKDNAGCPWARVDEVKEGSVLIADEGFVSAEEDGGVYNPEYDDWFCIQPGTELIVKKSNELPRYPGDEGLYVDCGSGEHLLDGQFEEDDHGDFYVGFYLKEK